MYAHRTPSARACAGHWGRGCVHEEEEFTVWVRPVQTVFNLQREKNLSGRGGAPLDQVIWEGSSEEVTFVWAEV